MVMFGNVVSVARNASRITENVLIPIAIRWIYRRDRMDDLISRDFIKSLGGECIAARDSKTHELLPISSIDALPSARPEQRWIPCSEWLPEQGARVLTCSKDGDIWINDYNPIAPTAWAIEPWAVIAWMPLPEPYKERREE